MAVQYLLWKESERLRAEKAELRRRKEEADAASARRAAYSFTASTEVSQGARRHRARVPRMTEAERAGITRNLESSYMTEDADGIPVPKTPGAALMAVETYLRLTQPPEIKFRIGGCCQRAWRCHTQKGRDWKTARNDRIDEF